MIWLNCGALPHVPVDCASQLQQFPQPRVERELRRCVQRCAPESAPSAPTAFLPKPRASSTDCDFSCKPRWTNCDFRTRVDAHRHQFRLLCSPSQSPRRCDPHTESETPPRQHCWEIRKSVSRRVPRLAPGESSCLRR